MCVCFGLCILRIVEREDRARTYCVQVVVELEAERLEHVQHELIGHVAEVASRFANGRVARSVRHDERFVQIASLNPYVSVFCRIESKCIMAVMLPVVGSKGQAREEGSVRAVRGEHDLLVAGESLQTREQLCASRHSVCVR